MSAFTFEELAERAVESLPDDLKERMSNVEIVIEDEPPPHAARRLGPGHELLGLYEGIPLTERGTYGNVLPDKISIYQGPIQRIYRDPAAIEAAVRRTVIHEIAHHFGIEEARLHELGWG